MTFIMDTEFVLCEVRTKILNIIWMKVRGSRRVKGCNGGDSEK